MFRKYAADLQVNTTPMLKCDLKKVAKQLYLNRFRYEWFPVNSGLFRRFSTHEWQNAYVNNVRHARCAIYIFVLKFHDVMTLLKGFLHMHNISKNVRSIAFIYT